MPRAGPGSGRTILLSTSKEPDLTGPGRRAADTGGPDRSVSMTGRIGVLTAGGDAPGLNAAIRAVARAGATRYGLEVVGFRNGWRGVMAGDAEPLTAAAVQGIVHRGGTILGSSGADPYHEHGVDR